MKSPIAATAAATLLLAAPALAQTRLEPELATRLSAALEVVVNLSDRGGLSTEPTEAECTEAAAYLADFDGNPTAGVTYRMAGNLDIIAKYAAPVCGRYAEAIEKFGLRYLLEKTLATPDRDGRSLAALLDEALGTEWTAWEPDPPGS